MTELSDNAILHAAQFIAQADALVIAAGADIGVDSGLRDFRGNDGFWNAYPALARSAIGFTENASPYAFRMEPEMAWGVWSRGSSALR